VGECFFWYRPTRVVPDQRPLNGRCVVVVVQLNHLIMQIQYQLTVASRTKADTSMTHRKAKLEDADMTELTSFIRNTALASHNDEQIITELDFRCIW